jgi:peptide/nickel transport system substrate-binding protein
MTNVLPPKEVPGLQSDNKFVVVNEQGFGYQGIYLNTKQAPFDNKNVRKAVDLLINRDSLVKVMFGDTATPGHAPFSETNLAYGESDKYEAPNVEQAKQLLAESGVSNVSFTMKTGTSPANAQLAQLVQNFLQAGGINMQIEKVEFGTLLEQGETGNFQALQLGWSGRPDPDQNIYDFIVTDGSNNDSQYSNPQVDDLLRQARAESDETKRKALYDQVMQILHDDVPYVYLYHQNNVFGMRSNIGGFTYVPDGIIRTTQLTKQ